MLIDPGRLMALASATKTAVVDYYTDNTIDLPDRRVVVPGLPAADCEMLAVHVGRVYPFDGNLGVESTPTLEGEAAFYMRGAQIFVYLVRCIPGLRSVGSTSRKAPPLVADEEAAAALILADPVHLWRALGVALDAGDLVGCGGIAWESWESVTPQGKLGGGTLTFRVSLE